VTAAVSRTPFRDFIAAACPFVGPSVRECVEWLLEARLLCPRCGHGTIRSAFRPTPICPDCLTRLDRTNR
jgi:hypothetical protein